MTKVSSLRGDYIAATSTSAPCSPNYSNSSYHIMHVLTHLFMFSRHLIVLQPLGTEGGLILWRMVVMKRQAGSMLTMGLLWSKAL